MSPFKNEALKDLTSLQERMNRIFNESVRKVGEIIDSGLDRSWSPPVDIYEMADCFIILADIPGAARENVNVEVQGGSLILKGDRPEVPEVQNGHPYRSERQYGAFERAFNLPVNVTPEGVTARIADGVLTVKISKLASEEGRIKVNIE